MGPRPQGSPADLRGEGVRAGSVQLLTFNAWNRGIGAEVLIFTQYFPASGAPEAAAVLEHFLHRPVP